MKKLVVTVLAIALLAGVGVGVWQWREEPAAPPGDAEASARALTVIPEVLPDFSLATLEGPPRTLSSFEQPSLIINFWATWCAPCRREIPLLRELRATRADQGVEVVGVAVDFREDVERYAAEIGLDYPLLIGEEDGLAAADLFGIDPVFPFTIFADGQRRIVAVKIGELHADEAAYILDRVAEVNAGSLELATARTLIRDEIRRLDGLREKPKTS